MTLTLRQIEIVNIARREGRVTVKGLANHFNVTLQSIRRDLSQLAESGKLDRLHGGATLPSSTANIGYEERRSINQSGKVDIARRCAQEIPENCSVFLNIGTTTEAVATELLEHRNILVVTNNMNVANILAGNDGCQVIVTGGTLRRSDGGLVGNLTTETIRQFKFDYAVIGCSALDEEGDILDFDIQEVGASRTILQQSRNVFLVADHTKFQRNAPARIGSLADVSCFVTDDQVTPALRELCDRWGTRVLVAGS